MHGANFHGSVYKNCVQSVFYYLTAVVKHILLPIVVRAGKFYLCFRPLSKSLN